MIISGKYYTDNNNLTTICLSKNRIAYIMNSNFVICQFDKNEKLLSYYKNLSSNYGVFKVTRVKKEA